MAAYYTIKQYKFHCITNQMTIVHHTTDSWLKLTNPDINKKTGGNLTNSCAHLSTSFGIQQDSQDKKKLSLSKNLDN